MISKGCYESTWQLPTAECLQMDHREWQTQRQVSLWKRNWCCLPHSLTCLVFIWRINRWVSFSFSKGLYMIRVRNSAKKNLPWLYNGELMRCHSDSSSRCWLFSNNCWETLLFPELGRLVLAHAQILLAIWAKVRSYGLMLAESLRVQ